MRTAFSVPLLLLALATGAVAEDWQSLGPGEIAPALADVTLQYDSASQRFFASGRSLYDAGQESWGYWREDAGTYCSQWPPGETWDCYTLDVNQAWDAFRFVARDGSETIGRITR